MYENAMPFLQYVSVCVRCTQMNEANKILCCLKNCGAKQFKNEDDDDDDDVFCYVRTQYTCHLHLQ